MTSTRTAFLFSLLCILFASFFSENLYARKITRNLTGFHEKRYRYEQSHTNYEGKAGGSRYYLNVYLPDRDMIVCSGTETYCCDRLRFIDRSTGNLIKAVPLNTDISDYPIYPLLINSKKNALILDGLDQIDLTSGEIVNNYGALKVDRDKRFVANSLKLTEDGKYLLGLFQYVNGKEYNGNDKRSTIYKIDYQTGSIVDSFPHNETVYDFVINEDKNELISYCRDEKLYIWNFKEKVIKSKVTQDWGSTSGTSNGFFKVLLNQPLNKNYLVVIIEDGNSRIVVYDLIGKKVLNSWLYDIWGFDTPAIAHLKNNISYFKNGHIITRDIISGDILNDFAFNLFYPEKLEYVNNDNNLIIDDNYGSIYDFDIQKSEIRSLAPFRINNTSLLSFDNGDVIVFNPDLNFSEYDKIGWLISKDNILKDRVTGFIPRERKNPYNDYQNMYSSLGNEYQFIKQVPGTNKVIFTDVKDSKNTLSIWDIEKKEKKTLSISSDFEFTAVGFPAEKSSIVYISSSDSNIYEFDIELDKIVAIHNAKGIVMSMSEIKNGKMYYVSDIGYAFYLNLFDFNTDKGELLSAHDGQQYIRPDYGNYKLLMIDLYPHYCFSKDGKYFAYQEINSEDTTHSLHIIDLNNIDNYNKPLYSFDVGSNAAVSMSFSSDNNFVAVGSYEKWFLVNLKDSSLKVMPLDYPGKIPYYYGEAPRRVNRILFSEKNSNKITYVTSEPSLVEEDISEYTSAPEPSLNKVFNLAAYPNPTEGVFSFEFVPRSSEATRIRVTNLLGETVYERTEFLPSSTVSEIAINLEDQFAGVYFISIDNGNERYNSAVVIKK